MGQHASRRRAGQARAGAHLGAARRLLAHRRRRTLGLLALRQLLGALWSGQGAAQQASNDQLSGCAALRRGQQACQALCLEPAPPAPGARRARRPRPPAPRARAPRRRPPPPDPPPGGRPAPPRPRARRPPSRAAAAPPPAARAAGPGRRGRRAPPPRAPAPAWAPAQGWGRGPAARARARAPARRARGPRRAAPPPAVVRAQGRGGVGEGAVCSADRQLGAGSARGFQQAGRWAGKLPGGLPTSAGCAASALTQSGRALSALGAEGRAMEGGRKPSSLGRPKDLP